MIDMSTRYPKTWDFPGKVGEHEGGAYHMLIDFRSSMHMLCRIQCKQYKNRDVQSKSSKACQQLQVARDRRRERRPIHSRQYGREKRHAQGHDVTTDDPQWYTAEEMQGKRSTSRGQLAAQLLVSVRTNYSVNSPRYPQMSRVLRQCTRIYMCVRLHAFTNDGVDHCNQNTDDKRFIALCHHALDSALELYT